MEVSVILKLNDIVLGDSSLQELSPELFESANELVIKRGEEEWTYSPSINQNGGFTSTNGNQDLSRATVMNLLGGQENYNWMLSQEGQSLPTAYSTQDSSVVVGGQEISPNFYVYPDGEVYLDGYNTPLTMDQIKELFPDLYETLVGGSGTTEETEESQKTTSSVSGSSTGSGGSTSSRGSGSSKRKETGKIGDKVAAGASTAAAASETAKTKQSQSSDAESSGKSTSASSAKTTAGISGDYSATASGDIVQIDYSNLDSMASSLKQSLTQLKGIAGDYESVVSDIKGSTRWLGTERDKIANLSSQEYASYINSVCTEAETLLTNIQKCMQAFQDAEEKIMNLTL